MIFWCSKTNMPKPKTINNKCLNDLKAFYQRPKYPNSRLDTLIRKPSLISPLSEMKRQTPIQYTNIWSLSPTPPKKMFWNFFEIF